MRVSGAGRAVAVVVLGAWTRGIRRARRCELCVGPRRLRLRDRSLAAGDAAGDQEVEHADHDDDQEEQPGDRPRPCRSSAGRRPSPRGRARWSGTGGRLRRCRRLVASKSFGSVKICRPPMVAVMITKIMVGRMLGSVMREEAADGAGAVERGRLVDVARYRLHGGEQDQGVVAGPAPVDHRGDGDVAGQDVVSSTRSGRGRRARASCSTSPYCSLKMLEKIRATATGVTT